MAQFTTEVGYSPQLFNFTGHVQIIEKTGGGGFPGQSATMNVIQNDQEVDIVFNWQTTGLDIDAGARTGHWHLAVHFERMGAGEGPNTLTHITPDAVLNSTWHSHTFTLPAGFFGPIPTLGQPGTLLYRVIASMTHYGNTGHTPLPVSGFAELGMLQVIAGA